MTRRTSRARSTEWLTVLDVDGPFLAAPVVTDVFPAGLPTLHVDAVHALREASTALDAGIGQRDAFVRHVLRDFLGWGDQLRDSSHLPAGLDVPVPEHHLTIRPTFALLPADDEPAPTGEQGSGSGGRTPLLLGQVLPPGTRAIRRAPGADTWAATPADRLAHALRHHDIPLGLLTDGTDWTLVAVTPNGPTSVVGWTRHAWLDELDTLKAFHALLGRQRFFGVGPSQTLPAMLATSLRRQEELTDRLSGQAHAAVEMLVATIGRADVDHRARHGSPLLPPEVTPGDVYSGCVTVLMRLLFLFYAEERDLLPLDEDTYGTHYALTTLVDQLREDADEHGEATLERSTYAWHRLLALSRAVHGGARHHQLTLNAYGGSLFDPDRYPWLEGRSTPDQPQPDYPVPPVDDRTMLRALEALKFVHVPGEADRRTVSFAVLDVEQIGYVYEGLLDQDAARADTWVCGIIGDTRGDKDGPEIPLTDLEAHLAAGVESFTAWLTTVIKESGGSLTPSAIAKRLTPVRGDDLLQAERIIRPVCVGDTAIVDRLLPFTRLLRRDPRDLPVVYGPGSLYLTESSARANTGAVYTPRFLAEQVVTTTLEPLVYAPGPLDTEDRDAWQILTPEAILDLKIIDIAAGSGAFLVSAARFLAAHLIKARVAHTPEHPTLELEPHEQHLAATRAVVDHCIYGVDINPLALEMAKLSLWLISLDKTRPFGFLDDRLAVGDSLLGVASVEQIRDLHLDPATGRALHKQQAIRYTDATEHLLKQAGELRRQIADIDLVNSRSYDEKRRLFDQASSITQRLTIVADALSSASLAGGTDAAYQHVSDLLQATDGDGPEQIGPAWETLRAHATFGLTQLTGHVRRPAHFPILFPEAFLGAGGFSAVVGNPPFLGGQKLTGTHGTNYREHLVRTIGRGARGSADLIAYMALRASDILDPSSGQLGIIGTNTLAQGDTREVGLDQLTAAGVDIRAAVKSAKWPTRGANLEYCIVWGSHQARAVDVRAVADGHPVAAITASLDPAGRVTGNPHRLAANSGLVFIGSYVHGLGFTMAPERAQELLATDPRNGDVLFPFISGEDLNSRPDNSASRWVINFHDWPLARAERYPALLGQVRELVKPERDKNKREARRRYWWRYAEPAPNLYRAMEGLDRVLAIALTSKSVMVQLVPARGVFSHGLAVFASSDFGVLALLSSSVHYWWAIARASSMRADLRYTPSDVFETLPLPDLTARMRLAGEALHGERSAFMLSGQLGLTKTYNLVHDPTCRETEVDRLRDLHRDVDAAVCAAYGWSDLDLQHGHYETRQGVRFTVAPAVQVELVDRLLELNFTRHAKEDASGLTRAKTPRASGTNGAKTPGTPLPEAVLFEVEYEGGA